VNGNNEGDIIFQKNMMATRDSVEHNNKVKTVYVKRVIELIEQKDS
jgi:hypothetical protein